MNRPPASARASFDSREERLIAALDAQQGATVSELIFKGPNVQGTGVIGGYNDVAALKSAMGGWATRGDPRDEHTLAAFHSACCVRAEVSKLEPEPTSLPGGGGLLSRGGRRIS